LKNVFFKYHAESSEYVLKNLNFKILPGETVALIGATGSAKSTLVQLIPDYTRFKREGTG